MKKIGITGGIGSGKSTVMDYISSQGYPVYCSDIRAKELMLQPTIIQEIQQIFDENVIENHQLDRKKIASIVFQNPEKLQQLNNIVHPAVERDFMEFCQTHQDKDFVFYESALMIETGNYQQFDKVILVTAPLETRIQRVMQRDSLSKKEIEKRIANQLSDEEKRKFIDFEIVNQEKSETFKQIEEILKILKSM
ncbi:dephospho-CoA kinase [Capnocytophaga sp. ARDL2]|uniref:dephospho-CoA kinase n=1 Tax=Capnocytophaga sp. ARDL2 TaxID=3238809 RepID=UPI0035579652